mgnify:CR=1 FL=1
MPVAVIPKPIKDAKRTLVILSLALAGCRGPLPVASPTPETLSLRLLADNATAPLLRDLVSHYRPENALIAWDIQVGESGTLLSWLRSSEVPYALVGYLSPELESSVDGSLWRTPIGVQGVAFIVHPANAISGLTAAQLRGILQGRITNWSELGGAPLPLTVIARDGRSSDAALVQAMILGERRTTRTARLATTGQAVVDLVSANPGAIGYVSTGYLQSSVRAVAVEGTLPLPENLSSEQYPLRAPIVFVGLEAPGNDAYRQFFAWAQSPAGQAIVRQRYGGLPIYAR